MKKQLTASLVFVCALTGCFERGNISSVKDGVMDFDKSLKVGEALDNWAQCTDKKWSEFKSPNGRKIVQFECRSAKVGEFSQYVMTHFPKRFEGLTVIAEEMTAIFQWTINTDDTFQLSAIAKHFKWSDGAETSDRLLDERLLQKVYANEVEYDVEQLKAPGGLDLAIIRMGNLIELRRTGAVITPPTKPVASSKATPAADKAVVEDKDEHVGD